MSDGSGGACVAPCAIPYHLTDRGREARRRWTRTPGGRAYTAAFWKSPEGKAAARRSYVRRRALKSVYRFSAGLPLLRVKLSKWVGCRVEEQKKPINQSEDQWHSNPSNQTPDRGAAFMDAQIRDWRNTANFRRALASRLAAWADADVAAGKLTHVDEDRALVAKLISDADAMDGRAARAIIDMQPRKRSTTRGVINRKGDDMK